MDLGTKEVVQHCTQYIMTRQKTLDGGKAKKAKQKLSRSSHSPPYHMLRAKVAGCRWSKPTPQCCNTAYDIHDVSCCSRHSTSELCPLIFADPSRCNQLAKREGPAAVVLLGSFIAPSPCHCLIRSCLHPRSQPTGPKQHVRDTCREHAEAISFQTGSTCNVSSPFGTSCHKHQPASKGLRC